MLHSIFPEQGTPTPASGGKFLWPKVDDRVADVPAIESGYLTSFHVFDNCS